MVAANERRRWTVPVWMIEGRRHKLDPVSQRNMAERRFAALAAAVREHEANARRRGGVRAQDRSLYTRLRQICGES